MNQWLYTRIESIKEYYIRPRKIALAYALIVFFCLCVLWLYVGHLTRERLLLEERLDVASRVNTIGTSLTLAINQRLVLITSVRAYMEAEVNRDRDLTFENIEQLDEVNNFAKGLSSSTVGIRNIAIAPDGVVQYVYPLDENQAVLGYEPIRDERPIIRDEVQRAIESRRVVLSLPYELIQGGQGLVVREAIYVDSKYWGLANVVLDVPALLEEAGIYPMPDNLKLALIDQAGNIFFGSENLLTKEPVDYTIRLPEGSWSLIAVPAAGWGAAHKSLMWVFRGLGSIAMITIPLVTYLFINRRDRLTDIVDRRTQELAKANQTLITVLEGIDADVYVADLHTHEILFANKHLRESFKNELVGKLCYQAFRHEPMVCAHCKNDFLLDRNGQPAGVISWEDFNPITKRWYRNADRAIHWHNSHYVHLQIATDITDHKHALAAVCESEERYRQAVENSPNPIFSITTDGIVQTWNQACEKTFHYDQIIIGQHYHILFRNEKDRSKVGEMLEKVHYGQSLSDVEMVYQRLDGEECYTLSRIYPLCNQREEVQGYVFANTDVTKQKRADDELKRLLQEKDILLAEVHHRVKNNMQVIVSLLSLQAGEIEDEQIRAVYEESRNRIKSMALVHEQLYRSKKYAHIEFEAYIDQLATTLFNTFHIDPEQIQLHITAESISIDLERAIPCGLLLNELLTNSLKYAFPNGSKGHIWIDFRPEGNSIHLTFDDDGIGLPDSFDLEETQSLGLQLVRLLTVHDLHGRIELGNGHKKGARFLIEFPLSILENECVDIM